MSLQENSYEAYVYAITEQMEQHISGLNELSSLFKQRPLTFNEKSAVERSLQVLIETAIGCSKHYLKKNQKPVPSVARGSIERVYELLAIVKPDINTMRSAVGMRNAIIHDYLNLDWNKVESVLREQKYIDVKQYVDTVKQCLLM
ncbi:MAG: DUF86 domain-containing protein [Gammaproteobacteria bacterium]|nr:DUF86 domain-containing protein [Gammaproteobacteria bacterium]